MSFFIFNLQIENIVRIIGIDTGRELLLFIENTSMDPCFNQALEEYDFDNMEEDVLLIWRNKPAVVCGKFQNIFAEVDVVSAREKSITLVRRITGGGTVYHDPGNINYSFIRHTDSNEVDYEPYLAPVMKALKSMGADSEIITGNGIAVNGKKISGSAQRIAKGKVLHHGTLLFDCDLGVLRSVANGARSFYTSKGTESTPWPVTNLKESVTDRSLTPEGFHRELLAELEKEFELRMVRLSESALAEIEELAESKYRSWEWTFGKNPSFTFARDFRYSGEDLRMEYSSARGIITEFLIQPDQSGLSEALTGRRLHLPEIEKALAQYPGFEDLIQYIL